MKRTHILPHSQIGFQQSFFNKGNTKFWVNRLAKTKTIIITLSKIMNDLLEKQRK